ncbi:MAG: F0F1 ATP synthase subunit delta [Bifidobacteriaceae bacterium]|jgi:F-type H+-transporting ATPase subunit delta|nr:F0F1 ATP synthase subunit delta [Bifidobacteriaceae bacterium]
MLGGSAASLAKAKLDLSRTLAKQEGQASRIGGELFALTDALDADPALARALTNPNREAAAKALLVRQAMAGHFEPAARLAARTAGLRWSKDQDLADALELMAFDASLAQAQAKKILRGVEAELFEVDVVLRNNRDLRTALGDVVAESAARVKLIERVFAKSVRPETMYLLRRVVAHPRGRGIRYSLKYVGDLVAERRGRLVVIVQTAAPLTPTQADALTKLLAVEYGRDIQLNVSIDHSMMGGLRLRVGDEVVDGSLATRFTELRRDLAA